MLAGRHCPVFPRILESLAGIKSLELIRTVMMKIYDLICAVDFIGTYFSIKLSYSHHNHNFINS